jgi:hypothetical protein
VDARGGVRDKSGVRCVLSLGILISVLVSVCVKLYSCCCASVLDAWADSGHCVDEFFVGWLLIYFLLLCLPYPVIASFLSLDFLSTLTRWCIRASLVGAVRHVRVAGSRFVLILYLPTPSRPCRWEVILRVMHLALHNVYSAPRLARPSFLGIFGHD